MKNVIQFLNGVKREFAKVVWPNQKELIGSTFVVLVLVVFFSVYLGSLDYVLGSLTAKILSL